VEMKAVINREMTNIDSKDETSSEE